MALSSSVTAASEVFLLSEVIRYQWAEVGAVLGAHGPDLAGAP